MQIFQGANLPILDPAFSNDGASNSVTKKVDGKFVLRPSSLNVHCYFSYAQNAILGKKSKPSGASAGGTAYHYALELAYQYKINQQTNPNIRDIQEIGVTNWKKAMEVDELHYSSKDSPAKMTDDIANGIIAYESTMKATIPLATETRFSIALPKPSNVYSQVSGSVDLLAVDMHTPQLGGTQVGLSIIDHKFTSKKSTEPKYRMQAKIYQLMAQANGKNVVSTRLHNMVRSQQLKTKTTPTQLQVVNPIDDQATTNLVMSRVNSLINMGEMYHFLVSMGISPDDAVAVAYPTTTPEVSFLCQELWCGWYHQCPINNPSSNPSFDLVSMLQQFKEKTNDEQ